MNWYALQVISGAEVDVVQLMDKYGCQTILPHVPIFLKQQGKVSVINRPLLPGYVFALSNPETLSRIKENERLKYWQRKIIRICGNGTSPVPLDDSEIYFFRMCSNHMWPLEIRSLGYGNSGYEYEILNPPPWADMIHVRWYDSDRFKANIILRDGDQFKDRSFNIAAINTYYTGSLREQLFQRLSASYHGQFEVASS